jgi:hypothetical protein
MSPRLFGARIARAILAGVLVSGKRLERERLVGKADRDERVLKLGAA